MIDALIETLAPYRERRARFEREPKLVWDILEDGNAKARAAARKTMDEVRAALGF